MFHISLILSLLLNSIRWESYKFIILKLMLRVSFFVMKSPFLTCYEFLSLWWKELLTCYSWESTCVKSSFSLTLFFSLLWNDNGISICFIFTWRKNWVFFFNHDATLVVVIVDCHCSIFEQAVLFPEMF